MTPTLKTLIDIRDRAQLAIEAEREAATAKDGLPEPKWERGFLMVGNRCIGTVSPSLAGGWRWQSLNSISGLSEKEFVAEKAVESAWAALSSDQKRAALGMTAPQPDPLPTPLPCICGQSYVPHVGTLSSGKESVSCRCGRMVAYPTRREAIERWNAMLTPSKSGPCNWCGQPDAVTKAAIAVANAFADYRASMLADRSKLWDSTLEKSNAYAVACAFAAGKAVQS